MKISKLVTLQSREIKERNTIQEDTADYINESRRNITALIVYDRYLKRYDKKPTLYIDKKFMFDDFIKRGYYFTFGMRMVIRPRMPFFEDMKFNYFYKNRIYNKRYQSKCKIKKINSDTLKLIFGEDITSVIKGFIK